MSNSNERLPATRPQSPPSTITIGGVPSVDLSSLPDHVRDELLRKYAEGVVDIAKKAQELQVDVGALSNTLDTLSKTTRDVSASGNSVTISHTQTNAAGHTEIKMGNTADAQSGRLTGSQTGQRDWTPYYVLAGIGAIVLIAAIVMGK